MWSPFLCHDQDAPPPVIPAKAGIHLPLCSETSYPLSRRGLTGVGKTDLQLRSGPVSLSFRAHPVIPSVARNLKCPTFVI